MAAPSKLQQQGATKVPHTFCANWNLLQNDCLNRVYMEYSRVTWLRIAGIRGWGIPLYGAMHTGLTWPCNGGKPNCLPHTHLNLTCMYMYVYIYNNNIQTLYVYFVQTRRTILWWFYMILSSISPYFFRVASLKPSPFPLPKPCPKSQLSNSVEAWIAPHLDQLGFFAANHGNVVMGGFHSHGGSP